MDKLPFIFTTPVFTILAHVIQLQEKMGESVMATSFPITSILQVALINSGKIPRYLEQLLTPLLLTTLPE